MCHLAYNTAELLQGGEDIPMMINLGENVKL